MERENRVELEKEEREVIWEVEGEWRKRKRRGDVKEKEEIKVQSGCEQMA